MQFAQMFRNCSVNDGMPASLRLILVVTVVYLVQIVWANDLLANTNPSNSDHQIVSFSQGRDGVSTDTDCYKIGEALKTFAETKGNWRQFSITYDDVHGLYGGFTLSVDGTGLVQKKTVRVIRGQKDVINTTSRAEPAQLNELVRLLVSERLWLRAPYPRAGVPDEGRSRVVMWYTPEGNSKKQCEIWEWYNDMEADRRIGKLRDFMLHLLPRTNEEPVAIENDQIEEFHNETGSSSKSRDDYSKYALGALIANFDALIETLADNDPTFRGRFLKKLFSKRHQSDIR